MSVEPTRTERSAAEPAAGGAPKLAVERREDGIAIVRFDDTAATHNTITPAFERELLATLDALLADDRARAVVFASGKAASFLVGANVDALRALRFAEDATEGAKRLARGFAKIAASDKPFVACIHGPALGGGFELALACDAIVASEDPRTVVGLPEVKLGLVPAGNGLLRVAERAGLAVALDLGLTGRSLRPARALALGLVDDVVPASVALEAACALAKRLAVEAEATRGLRGRIARLAKGKRPRARALRLWLTDSTRVGRALLFRKARTETTARLRGHYPASERIIDVLERYADKGFAAAADLEAARFGELVVSETSHRLVELFFALAASRKDAAGTAARESAPGTGGEAAEAAHVERIGVVGAGLIGAGIAAISAERGVVVRIDDKTDEALARAVRYVREHVGASAERGRLSPLEHAAALARVSTATDHSGMRSADLVVEAVFEDLALKQSVLRELEARVRPECVIASSTASIPVGRIAEGAAHPERVLGMHYFAPVTKVLLVEIVRGAATSPQALSTAVALGRRQGKTVIVVRDGVGFYTTRTLAPYVHEALRLVEEGVPVETVDQALLDWGFPFGPLHLLDELGLDLSAHVAGVLHEAFGDRLTPPPALAALRLDDRKGRKNGRGFYFYGRGARAEKRVDDTVYAAIGVEPRKTRKGLAEAPKREEIQVRCALALVNEALRTLDEGIVKSARDGDLGAVLGLGFPAFRGGPFRYVDTLGSAEVLRRMRALEQRHGARFTPSPALVEAARRGRRFWSP